MNTNKNKFLSVIIVAILLASISAFAGIAVPVKAQATPNIPPNVTLGTPQIPTTGGLIPAGVTANENIVTLPWLSFSPNPIGVGQSLLGKCVDSTSSTSKPRTHRIHCSHN